ncbi:gamma-glutamylcyclotransferase family protein [Pseudoalteromonas piscicida]|uniref:Gamma-glutamylcyclotransferase n=1 Tax=Pseudoalteromonas piscicida TaxID=43662 RepID=A0A2A5JPV8_PSEO7|nr:gamma-glutamylcyclotransferase family protein [Pseudoalteromonas piscicida]PCK31465.1 gamma-glutamylcyclotransferase [Pseudoalteromonas piscicida]
MSEKNIVNFSFGSNMSTARLLARLPEAKLLGVGILNGYRLTFDMLSTDGSAKCSITPCVQRSSQVYGVLYALNQEEKLRLDEIEGERYTCQRVPVALQAGSTLDAWCYIANTFVEDELPFDWYVKHVLAGAQEHRFPFEYQKVILEQSHIIDNDTDRKQRELAIYQSIKGQR